MQHNSPISIFTYFQHVIIVIAFSLLTPALSVQEQKTLALSRKDFGTERVLSCPKDRSLWLISYYINGSLDLAENFTVTKDTEGVEMTDEGLRILSFQPQQSGQYRCQLSNGSFIIYTLFVPPIIKRFDQSKNFVQEDQLKLVCEVIGYPRPTEITWQFTKDEKGAVGVVLPSAELPSIEVTNGTGSGDEHSVQSELKIATLEFDNRGHYQCFAQLSLENNTEFNDTQTTLIRVKDKLAALWPFIGILVEVVVLCIIIFIYEKKRSKNEEDEDDEVREEISVSDGSYHTPISSPSDLIPTTLSGMGDTSSVFGDSSTGSETFQSFPGRKSPSKLYGELLDRFTMENAQGMAMHESSGFGTQAGRTSNKNASDQKPADGGDDLRHRNI